MFLYLKMRHRPWDVDSHKAWEPDDGFQWYKFFFFFISYLYDAKNMLPGL